MTGNNDKSWKETEIWLKDIENWLSLKDLNVGGTFDLLLSDESAVIWRGPKSETTLYKVA